MKKFVLLIFVFILFHESYSQLNLSGYKWEDKSALFDSIVSTLPDKFQVVRDDTTITQPFICLLRDTRNREVSIVYFKRMSGENKALEIEGTPVVEVYGFSGAFLDLFPLWERLNGKKLDLETTSKRHNSGYVRGNTMLFEEQEEGWVILY